MNFIGRLEKLERLTATARDNTSWRKAILDVGDDGRYIGAQIDDVFVARNAGESLDQFEARIEAVDPDSNWILTYIVRASEGAPIWGDERPPIRGNTAH